jgi:ABC-type branched-subunit amino acid transport system substrate-binding protein
MKIQGYELKKGDFICIPFAKGEQPDSVANESAADDDSVTDGTVSGTGSAKVSGRFAAATPVQQRAINLGVMLPLHDINGDGRRMVEYYRGVLMACDSLKRQGISVNVHAWNTAEDSDISQVLREEAAQQCDVIIGPLYSKQMPALSEFVTQHDILLVIPFSINAPQLFNNGNIFQIYQSQSSFNETAISRFVERFQDAHPVVIDCNDTTSTKGDFTFRLRRSLESKGVLYSITNLKSTESTFAKAFSHDKQNVVVLNTGRSQELNIAMAKLNTLTMSNPELKVSLFGYADWLGFTRYQLENFYKYDTYLPTPYYMNPLSSQTTRFEQRYRTNFHADMMATTQRFAAAGFDHAFFFLKGLHKYGKTFNGAAGMFGYQPIQTPLRFERIGNGGFQNRTQLLVHYKPEHKIEVIQ